MNLLYLHCHDAGRCLAPWLPEAPTPHLAGLARESVVFDQAFCAGPTCSPSRAALLTGQSPHAAGMIGLTHRRVGRLREPQRHLAAQLRSAGWDTFLAGIQHEFQPGEELPYAERFRSSEPDQAGQDRATAEAVAAWLARRERRDVPFFLSCGFSLPHREFPAPADPDLAGLPPPAGQPDTPEVRDDWARYLTAARRMDAAAGTVLAALRDGGWGDDTLVLFTTDHGIPFPGRKCRLRDGGIGVALLLRLPGGRGGGRRMEALVSHVDLVPTILDRAGLPHPDGLEGHSLWPLLDGRTDTVREAVFAETNWHAAYEPQRAIRTPRWKYIRRYDSSPRLIAANMDDSPSKDAYLAIHPPGSPLPAEELYDLAADPAEEHNLASDPAHQPIRDHLHQRLEAWMRETSDPLLDGPIPAPVGGEINHPEDRSPTAPRHTVA